jgi:hypothetical protein
LRYFAIGFCEQRYSTILNTAAIGKRQRPARELASSKVSSGPSRDVSSRALDPAHAARFLDGKDEQKVDLVEIDMPFVAGYRPTSSSGWSETPKRPLSHCRTPSCRFTKAGGTSFGPWDRRSASDDPGLDGYLVSRWHGRGGTQIGESGASLIQAETGCPAASRLNARIVDPGTLAAGSGAARSGKKLVRRVAVRPQCGCNQFHESERRSRLIEE